MPEAHFYTAASSGDWIGAGVAIAIAFVVAQIVDRAIAKRGAKVGELVTRGELSPAAQTRLRLIRRLTFVGIVLIGVAIAALKIPEASNIATGLLASSAVLGLVIGFAARQTLANAIAGILLALTQPIRIGDLVTFEEQTGEVEDMKLTYTYIRLDDGRRLIVPNERLAESSVLNHTILDPRVQVEVCVAAGRRRPRQGHGADPGRAGGNRRVGGGGGQGGRAADCHRVGVRPRRAWEEGR